DVTPAANQFLMLFSSTSTPPVGINFMFGNSGLIPFKNPVPSVSPGNSFTNPQPANIAFAISVGVIQPGIHKQLFALAVSASSATKIGLTKNSVPSARKLSAA